MFFSSSTLPEKDNVNDIDIRNFCNVFITLPFINLCDPQLMEEMFGTQEENNLVGEGGEGVGDQEDEINGEEEEEEEEEESDSSDDEDVDCCERHYTNPLDAPLGRYLFRQATYVWANI